MGPCVLYSDDAHDCMGETMKNVPTQWSDAYRIGIDDIDEQHKSFFALVHSLAESARSSVNVGKAVRAVVAMRSYAFKHFHTEETLMARVGFPRLYEHTRLHDAYLRDLMVFTEELAVYAQTPDMDVDEAFLDLMERIAAYSAQWWAEHIQLKDTRYAKHIREMKSRRA